MVLYRQADILHWHQTTQIALHCFFLELLVPECSKLPFNILYFYKIRDCVGIFMLLIPDISREKSNKYYVPASLLSSKGDMLFLKCQSKVLFAVKLFPADQSVSKCSQLLPVVGAPPLVRILSLFTIYFRVN